MSQSEISIKKQLDAICDLFEENWSKDERPQFDTYLTRVGESHRDQLLLMLVEIDVDLRRKNDLLVSSSDYEALGNGAITHVDELLSTDMDATMPPGDLNRNSDQHLTALPAGSNATSPGRMIGPYKLLQQIGEGGMGSVWMAEQEKPVRRRVALKLIRADLGSKEVVARFEAERQALAMMDHQNIARVLDAGTTDDGSPYFVMELVKGIPITQFCDDNKLSIKERLELFVPVCKAIQHAHQKGIIHRDLKPSNVLVTLYDGEPVPKVIDFGLAKALEHTTKLTDKTMFTEFGKVVGTVQYMSPEQAEMNALDVDTRTDVYSLGVMLYELLTGSTPLDKETIGKNAILQILAIIKEKEPPRPSNRLSSSAETLTGISEQRKINPDRLQKILRGELDWVVMKALEKDRRRRYETASDFAQDIQRYLDDETVEARPPSIVYRTGKFIKRNKAWVLAISALLLIAGISSVITNIASRIEASNKKQEVEEAANGFFDLMAQENISAIDSVITDRMRQSKFYETLTINPEIGSLWKGKLSRFPNSVTISGNNAVASYEHDESDRGDPLSIYLRFENGTWLVDRFGDFELTMNAIIERGEKNEKLMSKLLRREKSDQDERTGDTKTSRNDPAPQFPNAIVDVPDWVGDDLPFDAAEFVRPNVIDNAAPIYMDAFADFITVYVFCFESLKNIEQLSPINAYRWGRGYALNAWLSRETSRLMSNDYVVYPNFQDEPSLGYEHDDILYQFSVDTFAKFAAAQLKENCVFQNDFDQTRIVHPGIAARESGRLFMLSCLNELYKGNLELSINRLNMMLKLCRDVRPRGSEFDQSLSSVEISQFLEKVVAVSILRSDQLTIEHCDLLLEILNEQEKQSLDPIVEASRYEHLLFRKLIHSLEKEEYSLDRADLFGEEWIQTIPQLLAMEFMSNSRRYGGDLNIGVLLERIDELEKMKSDVRDSNFDAAKFRKLIQQHQEQESELSYETAITLASIFTMQEYLACKTEDYEQMRQMLNKRYSDLLEANKLPFWKRMEAMRMLDTEWTSDKTWKQVKLFRLFKPQSWQYARNVWLIRRIQFELVATKCLIAIKRWQLEKKSNPPSLAEALRVIGINEVPIDPLFGKPIMMGIKESEFFVYSMGPDGDDDLGEKEIAFDRTSVLEAKENNSDGDILFGLKRDKYLLPR